MVHGRLLSSLVFIVLSVSGFAGTAVAQTRSGPVTIKAARIRVPFPKTWLSAEPNAYLPQSVHWYHPAGARIVITATPKKTGDTLATWTARIKGIAASRKITLDPPKSAQALGAEAMRITGRTRTHQVEFFFFFHKNQLVLVNFTCEAKSISACVVASEYERVIDGLEAL
ncbi:hypothetical protein KKC22_14955 [Myxococcota bacterium]|jgi:hypothetical protein|nr:hypothetical protein [Myxococcota bacterium]